MVASDMGKYGFIKKWISHSIKWLIIIIWSLSFYHYRSCISPLIYWSPWYPCHINIIMISSFLFQFLISIINLSTHHFRTWDTSNCPAKPWDMTQLGSPPRSLAPVFGARPPRQLRHRPAARRPTSWVGTSGRRTSEPWDHWDHSVDILKMKMRYVNADVIYNIFMYKYIYIS